MIYGSYKHIFKADSSVQGNTRVFLILDGINFYHFTNFKQFYLGARMELNKKLSIHIDVKKSYLSIGEVSRTFRALYLCVKSILFNQWGLL